MPSSGSIPGSWNGSSTSSISLRVDWEVIDRDTANKTSTVRFKWIARRSSSQRTTNKTNARWTQSVAGSTPTNTSGSINFDIRNTAVNTDYVFLTKTAVIQHNPDGTKTAAVSGTIDLSGTSAGVGSWSGSIVLPRIAVTPPTVDSLTISDAGTGISTVNRFVATKSRIQITAAGTAYDGATVATYAFYANGNLLQSGAGDTYTGAQPAVAGNYTIKVVITDSYGLTAEATDTLTVEPYSAPVINETKTFRSDNSNPPQPDTDGAWVAVKATWTIASCDGQNTSTCVASVSGSSDTLAQNTPKAIGGSLSPTSAYTITYTVTDAFGTTATKQDVIYSAFKNLNLFPDNTVGGFAFGEAAEQGKGKFNVDYLLTRGDFEAEGDATIGGDITAGGAVAADDFTAPITLVSDAISISTSGITIEEQECARFGKIATVCVRISGTIAAGASVSGTIASGWRPATRATGAGYYSQTPFIMQIAPDGGITIRNASANSRSPSSGTPLTVAATYILA